MHGAHRRVFIFAMPIATKSLPTPVGCQFVTSSSADIFRDVDATARRGLFTVTTPSKVSTRRNIYCIRGNRRTPCR
jgi:hypothetical protein